MGQARTEEKRRQDESRNNTVHATNSRHHSHHTLASRLVLIFVSASHIYQWLRFSTNANAPCTYSTLIYHTRRSARTSAQVTARGRRNRTSAESYWQSLNSPRNSRARLLPLSINNAHDGCTHSGIYLPTPHRSVVPALHPRVNSNGKSVLSANIRPFRFLTGGLVHPKT